MERGCLRSAAIEGLLVRLFLEAHKTPPKEIILDLDATDDPLHGEQEGRFFHGYYDHYCYLPLYLFCGDHVLCCRLRESNRDAAAGSVTANVTRPVESKPRSVRPNATKLRTMSPEPTSSTRARPVCTTTRAFRPRTPRRSDVPARPPCRSPSSVSQGRTL